MSETHAPGAVRNALRRLADGTAPRRETAYEAVIAEATTSLTCARDAAAFVAENEDRLARAVADADAAGETATAERGRRALAVLRRLRSAARGTDSGGGDADQFHSGHGTVLPDAGQPENR